jgi:16S rRNA processing protein RimM
VDWDGLALVGQVARAHGLRGQVILNVETDFPEERFAPGAELFIQRGGRIEPVTIETVRFQRGRPVVSFAGFDSVDLADSLAGLELRVPLDRLTPLPEGVFYRHDLIGCRVEREDGTTIGTVADVEMDSGGNRLVVDGPGGSILVPLAREICPTIDPTGKRIVIHPPEGLLELNARP